MSMPITDALALLAACGNRKDSSALLARVTLPQDFKATCLDFKVLDSSGGSLLQKQVSRATGATEVRIGLYRATLPEQVTLTVQPLWGTGADGCEAPLANGPSSSQPGTFPASGVTEVMIPIQALTTAQDRDGDHFAGTQAGGPDCNDDDAAVHPGATEQCMSGVDYDCNSKAGCADPVCDGKACVAPPTQIVFSTAPLQLTAGDCSSALTLEARDARNQPQTVSGPTALLLSASPDTGVTFYADSACTTAATQITVFPGASRGSFYLRATKAGSLTLTAQASGIGQATQPETVFPAKATTLVLAGSAQTLSTDAACSQPITLQTFDAFGNTVAPSANLPVTLAASPSNGVTFYAGAGCSGAATTTLTVPLGTTSATFSFRATKTGTFNLSASAAGYSPGAQDATITPGLANALAFSTPPANVSAGVCTALGLESHDAAGNAAPVTAATSVTLTSNPALVTFYADAACSMVSGNVTLGANTSSATVYFKATQAGSTTLSATAAGFASASQSATITPAAPASLAFSSLVQSKAAGTCSAAVTVQTRDAFGSASSVSTNTAVNLSASPGTGFAFYSDASCTNAVSSATIAANTNTATFYFKGTQVASVTLTASASGLTSATQPATITAGAAFALAITPATQSVAVGTCSAQVQAQVHDAFGNVTTIPSGRSVTLTSSATSGFAFYSDVNCTSAVTSVTLGANASAVPFYFKGTQAGSVQISVATSGGINGDTQTQTLTPGTPSVLAFSTAAQTLVAGVCSSKLTIQSRDNFGNTVAVGASTSVTLNVSPTSGFTFYLNPDCTGPTTTVNLGPGNASADVYFSSTKPGTFSVSLSATGFTNTPQSETITAAPASAIVITSAAQTLAVNACSTAVALQVKDAFGNQVNAGANTTVNLTASPSAGLTFYSNGGCTTPVTSVTIAANANGASFFFKTTQAGTVTLTATPNNSLTADSQDETLTAGAAKQLSIDAPAQTLIAGKCSDITTVRALDQFGNPTNVTAATAVTLTAAPGANFAFYSDATCSTPITSVSIAAGTMSKGFYFRGTTTNTVMITASNTNFTPSGTQTETITPAPPTTLAITSAAQAALPAGQCSTALTVEARDSFGNRTTNAATTVNFSASPTTNFTFYSNSTCTTPATSVDLASGTGSLYFLGLTGGTFTVTAAATGLTSDTQSETLVGMMRSGTCTMNGTSANCTISPALTDTTQAFIVFQANVSDTGADASNVICAIASASQVTCTRNNATGTVNIAWYIPQFVSTGINVQHYQPACVNGVTAVTLTKAVNPANTFLLVSSQRNVTNQSGSLTRTAWLASGTTVNITISGNCSGSDKHDLQVVEIPGATVTRGSLTNVTGTSKAVTGLTNSPTANTFLLYSYRLAPTSNAICDRALRGSISSPTALSFSRADGSSNSACSSTAIDEIVWERVQLPAGSSAQEFDTALAVGVASGTQALTPVDTTRAMAFSGGQWTSGQGQGEGSLDTQSILGDTRARYQITAPNSVTVTRDSTLGTAHFTSFVTELLP